MNTFNWVKGISFGILIWAIMFLVVWATIAMGIFSSLWVQAALALVAGGVAYMFSINAKASGMNTALGYGFAFVVLGVALDLIFSQRYVADLFNHWAYYLAYALVLFAPSVELGLRGHTNVTVAR